MSWQLIGIGAVLASHVAAYCYGKREGARQQKKWDDFELIGEIHHMRDEIASQAWTMTHKILGTMDFHQFNEWLYKRYGNK